jgi:hypothetical protein
MKTKLSLLCLIVACGFFTIAADGTDNAGSTGCASPHGHLSAGATADPTDPTKVNVNVGGQIDFAKRPLTIGERQQIHDAAFNFARACVQTPTCDEQREITKLTDRMRYRYRVSWRTAKPLIVKAWGEGKTSVANP